MWLPYDPVGGTEWSGMLMTGPAWETTMLEAPARNPQTSTTLRQLIWSPVGAPAGCLEPSR